MPHRNEKARKIAAGRLSSHNSEENSSFLFAVPPGEVALSTDIRRRLSKGRRISLAPSAADQLTGRQNRQSWPYKLRDLSRPHCKCCEANSKYHCLTTEQAHVMCCLHDSLRRAICVMDDVDPVGLNATEVHDVLPLVSLHGSLQIG